MMNHEWIEPLKASSDMWSWQNVKCRVTNDVSGAQKLLEYAVINCKTLLQTAYSVVSNVSDVHVNADDGTIE